MIYYKNNNFILYHGDTMCLLNQLKQANYQADMIFADPPYFLSKGFTIKSGNKTKCFDKGKWDRIRPLEEINKFNKEWLSLCRDCLKDNGTIWVSGTYHNIYSVANCMTQLGYKILNIIVWQKPDAPTTLSHLHFNFSAEYIIWARKDKKHIHFFNYELMNQLNGGKRMSDVWNIPTVGSWEKHFGKHPTQKPLRLLYRIILASTKENDSILDPFAGSCTTGIAANLLKRNFIGIDQSEEFLALGIKRKEEICDKNAAKKIFQKMSENPNEIMVIINHARENLRKLMIQQGICYLRAGDSKGSLLVTPGFERIHYLLLHTNGNNANLFKLKTPGHFQIWTKENLTQYGFHPEHAPYYIVLPFEKTPIPQIQLPNLKERINTFKPKIKPLSDFY